MRVQTKKVVDEVVDVFDLLYDMVQVVSDHEDQTIIQVPSIDFEFQILHTPSCSRVLVITKDMNLTASVSATSSDIEFVHAQFSSNPTILPNYYAIRTVHREIETISENMELAAKLYGRLFEQGDYQ